MDKTSIALLGSTGSIGCNTLRVVESLGTSFKVVAMSAFRNTPRLREQVAKFRPEILSIGSEEGADRLAYDLKSEGGYVPRILVGLPGLIEVATYGRAGCIVSAIVGAVGLLPTLNALECGKRVALANKEVLVMAGELVTRSAESSSAELLPIDSEHNALHQCLRGERRSEVRRLILTASGGPFRITSKEAMYQASVSEATNHPTWNMGAKISVDSATLMNKGLEVIEAHWIFGFPGEKVNILVHPESVVHSMIELIDGSVIAQMGVADMRHAIQYALTYPDRCPCGDLPPLDLTGFAGLHFEPPDFERFPCLGLAYQALRAGGAMPAVMNAANEEAVEAFIRGKIHLTDIPTVVERVMQSHKPPEAMNLAVVIEADRSARLEAAALIDEFSGSSSGMRAGSTKN